MVSSSPCSTGVYVPCACVKFCSTWKRATADTLRHLPCSSANLGKNSIGPSRLPSNSCHLFDLWVDVFFYGHCTGRAGGLDISDVRRGSFLLIVGGDTTGSAEGASGAREMADLGGSVRGDDLLIGPG